MTAGGSSDMSDICDSNMRVLRNCLVLKEDSRQWSLSSSFSGAPTSASSREVKWADRLCFNHNNLFSASCVSRHSLSWNVSETDTELSPRLTSDLSKAEQRGISLRRSIKFHVHRGVKPIFKLSRELFSAFMLKQQRGKLQETEHPISLCEVKTATRNFLFLFSFSVSWFHFWDTTQIRLDASMLKNPSAFSHCPLIAQLTHARSSTTSNHRAAMLNQSLRARLAARHKLCKCLTWWCSVMSQSHRIERLLAGIKGPVCKRSWLCSLTPDSSDTDTVGRLTGLTFQHKPSVFDELEMRLNNQLCYKLDLSGRP